MTDLKEQNRSFYRCTVFFREMYAKGLRHTVISPGSRSTPLTLAAAAHFGLQKHIILDERSAGFTALGIGKSTGLPALLICTSGTATANYYPAVIEAKQSGVPLLLATADRPSSLTNTDANQTIDQTDLYGNFVLSFNDFESVGVGQSQEDSIKELVQKVFDQALSEGGPVHLNFPFSKPLEPEASFIKSIEIENRKEAEKKGTASAAKAKKEVKFTFPKPIQEKLQNCIKPAIVIGQLPPNVDTASIFELAGKLKSPVLSEQDYYNLDLAIQGFDGFLKNEYACKQLSPDLILRFGLQPASKSLLTALEDWDMQDHIYLTSAQNPKKSSLPVTETLLWNGMSISFNNTSSSEDSWLQSWKSAEQDYIAQRAEAFANISTLTDGHIYRKLSKQIPKNWSIFFSNSFPARDRSLFGSWSTQKIFTNRGASGIDGVTSTAMGIGIGTDKAGILFTGDLAFLHDSNALLNHKNISKPLVVVVINNNGGSIFRMLPISEYAEYFTQYFETPQQADISKLCEAYRIDCQSIKTVGELEVFDLKAFTEQSDSKLCIVECKTDPEASMQLRSKLWNQS